MVSRCQFYRGLVSTVVEERGASSAIQVEDISEEFIRSLTDSNKCLLIAIYENSARHPSDGNVYYHNV